MSDNKENEDFFITTMNKTGYMTAVPDEFSERFIHFAAKHYPELVLEVGTAYGVTTHLALKSGANMIANDLDHRHIKILIEKTPPELRHHLHPLVAKIPQLNFAPETLMAILACRVLHFLTGEELRQTMQAFASWLKPGGRVYIVAETPYIGTLRQFETEFVKRQTRGDEWPSFIEHTEQYWEERIEDLPPTIHPLEPIVLTREAARAGLLVMEARCFARPEFPHDLQRDGRESVGLVAIKP